MNVGFRIVENRMEKKMDNDLETGVIQGLIGMIRV